MKKLYLTIAIFCLTIFGGNLSAQELSPNAQKTITYIESIFSGDWKAAYEIIQPMLKLTEPEGQTTLESFSAWWENYRDGKFTGIKTLSVAAVEINITESGNLVHMIIHYRAEQVVLRTSRHTSCLFRDAVVYEFAEGDLVNIIILDATTLSCDKMVGV